jgi:hypothetical protein
VGRLGTFVPRLVALTVVWLLATTALTYAAAQRITATPTPAATTTAAAAPAPKIEVVPDVRRQPFVFAKATLGDGGFSWRVEGSVHGFAANVVTTQSPAAGTRLIDTGAPLVVLRLARGSGAQAGVAEDASEITPTVVKRADLATRAVAVESARKLPAHKAAAPRKAASAKTPVRAKTKRATTKPAHRAPRWPQHRPPLFTVPGGRREPLDEMPLAVRAKLLLDWLHTSPQPTDPNVRRWLYQHAWVVAGARMGWWQGDSALRTLIAADNRVWALWGIGARSESIAREALNEVDARSK